MKLDLTQKVERVESFEERLGVTFSGIYAVASDEDTVHVRGEILSRSGDALSQSIRITATVFDDKGRVIETSTESVDKEEFFGFALFDIRLEVEAKDISRIRLHPAPSRY